jgi:hypothetical protein
MFKTPVLEQREHRDGTPARTDERSLRNCYDASLVNKATILGHVGQDAEVKKLITDPDKTVVNFSVATTEYRKDAEGTKRKNTEEASSRSCRNIWRALSD